MPRLLTVLGLAAISMGSTSRSCTLANRDGDSGDDPSFVAHLEIRDLNGDQKTQVRGGTGLFSGKPPYVWISNQIGNTGVLYGFIDTRNTTAYPFNPDPDRYKPAASGGTEQSTR